jgi:hypothetical protein
MRAQYTQKQERMQGKKTRWRCIISHGQKSSRLRLVSLKFGKSRLFVAMRQQPRHLEASIRTLCLRQQHGVCSKPGSYGASRGFDEAREWVRLQRSLNALLLWTTRLALLLSLSVSMRPSVLVVVARERRRSNGMGITRRHGTRGRFFGSRARPTQRS